MANKRLITLIVIVVLVLLVFTMPDLEEEPVFCDIGNTISARTLARVVTACFAEGGKQPSFQLVNDQCQIVCVDPKEESNINI